MAFSKKKVDDRKQWLQVRRGRPCAGAPVLCGQEPPVPQVAEATCPGGGVARRSCTQRAAAAGTPCAMGAPPCPQNFVPGTFLDHTADLISYSDFVHKVGAGAGMHCRLLALLCVGCRLPA